MKPCAPGGVPRSNRQPVDKPVTNFTSPGDYSRVLLKGLGISGIRLTNADPIGKSAPSNEETHSGNGEPNERLGVGQPAKGHSGSEPWKGKTGPRCEGHGSQRGRAQKTFGDSVVESAASGGASAPTEARKANCPDGPRSDGAVIHIDGEGTTDEADAGGP